MFPQSSGPGGKPQPSRRLFVLALFAKSAPLRFQSLAHSSQFTIQRIPNILYSLRTLCQEHPGVGVSPIAKSNQEINQIKSVCCREIEPKPSYLYRLRGYPGGGPGTYPIHSTRLNENTIAPGGHKSSPTSHLPEKLPQQHMKVMYPIFPLHRIAPAIVRRRRRWPARRAPDFSATSRRGKTTRKSSASCPATAARSHSSKYCPDKYSASDSGKSRNTRLPASRFPVRKIVRHRRPVSSRESARTAASGSETCPCGSSRNRSPSSVRDGRWECGSPPNSCPRTPSSCNRSRNHAARRIRAPQTRIPRLAAESAP